MVHKPYYCSFCAKRQNEVRDLIQGPDDRVLICDECVGLCVKVLEDRRVQTGDRKNGEAEYRSWTTCLTGETTSLD